ncbi:MAG: sugar transferase [Novosphingobium sp.]|nr:sugar transferase [Novosphingobium sp.]
MNAPFSLRHATFSGNKTDSLLIAPSLERRRLQCYVGLLATDALAVMAGFAFASYFYLGSAGGLLLGQIVLPIFLTIALYNGAYSVAALEEPWRGLLRTFTALAISSAAVVFIAFYLKSSADFSRVAYTLGGILAALALIWSRLQMRSFIRWRCGMSVTNELVIDDGGPQVDLPGALRVSAEAMQLSPCLNDPHALDRIGLVLRNIDKVIVSCPPERRADWAMMLKGANVEGEVLDDQVARLGAQGARTVDGRGLLLVSAGPLGMRSRAIKRLLDVVLTCGALVILAPFFLAVAIAIKLEDGGPVFFIQRRMGRGNRFFNMFKFRSMSVAMSDGEGTVSTSRNDQRVTRVRGFLRRTSIDELPQLLNVLLGDMSLVGPRPHAIGSQAGDKLFWEVDLRYWQRHCLKPGMSGLAQVRGFRGATERESDLTDRLQSDLEYLEGWTILRDMKIIAMTVGVLVHERAY